MGLYYNGKKVRNLYYNGKCITRLALGKEMTRLVEGDDFVRAQWLRIDVNTMRTTQMMILPVNSYQFSFKRKWLRQGTYTIHSSYFTVEGYFYFTNQNIKMLIWDGANATHIYDSGTRFNLGDTITINCNAENYNFNGVSMPIYGVCKSIPLDCIVDNPSVDAVIAFSTSSITVDGVERYIPCRLLRPIPATLDANGIARNADECGMYDAVSGKFYGNVASSGTFTVEPSLIEGVDYERHRYLEGDGTAHINIPVNIYTDTVNTLLIPKVDWSVIAYQGMKSIGNNNVAEFRVMIGGTQELTIRHGVRINDTATSIIKTFANNYIGKIFEISTYRNESNYCGTINGTTYSIDNGDIQSANTDITVAIILKQFKLGYFSIPTKFSLYPVRLLRPLPSYLDANGMARKQFECGMLDLKTMKFYGNVNTSGKFTVSDN